MIGSSEDNPRRHAAPMRLSGTIAAAGDISRPAQLPEKRRSPESPRPLTPGPASVFKGPKRVAGLQRRSSAHCPHGALPRIEG